MFKVENITKDWKEAGSLQAHINLYGFWDEHCFLTKTGDLGSVLRIGGIDYRLRVIGEDRGSHFATIGVAVASPISAWLSRCSLHELPSSRQMPLSPTANFPSHSGIRNGGFAARIQANSVSQTDTSAGSSSTML